MGLNMSVFIVKTNMDSLFNCINEFSIYSQKNVMYEKINLDKPFGFSYQLEGEQWCHIITEEGHAYIFPLEKVVKLKYPVIELVFSGTTGCGGYSVYENGDIVESFSYYDYDVDENGYGYKPEGFTDLKFDLEKLDSDQEEFDNDDEDEENIVTVRYFSKIRDFKSKTIEELLDSSETVLKEYGVFEPCFTTDHFINFTEKGAYTIKKPGKDEWLWIPDQDDSVVPIIDRIDFFQFGYSLES